MHPKHFQQVPGQPDVTAWLNHYTNTLTIDTEETSTHDPDLDDHLETFDYETGWNSPLTAVKQTIIRHTVEATE